MKTKTITVTGVAKMSATKTRIFWKSGVAACTAVVDAPMVAPAVGETVTIKVKGGHVVSVEGL